MRVEGRSVYNSRVSLPSIHQIPWALGLGIFLERKHPKEGSARVVIRLRIYSPVHIY